MTKAELLALAEQCEAAAEPDREIDGIIEVHFGEMTIQDLKLWRQWKHLDSMPDALPREYMEPPYYTSSLDAALALLPEGYRLNSLIEYGMGNLQGKPYASVGPRDMSRLPRTFEAHNSVLAQAVASTPALAITAACLRAAASMMDK